MFLNALMLAGIAGAAVPLVLHLLARARYRSVDWGAMMFLDESKSHQHQSTKLKQLILLLIRMAIVSALAVALARPVVSRDWLGLTQAGRATVVIVLDCSASMAIVESGRTRLDLAKESALRVLAGLRSGDLVSLVVVGEPGKTPVDSPTSDLQAVSARVAALKPSVARADVAGALSRALQVFEAQEPMRRELYLITDRQANNWETASGAFATGFTNRFRTAVPSSKFTVVAVGSDVRDKLVVEAVDVPTRPAIVGQALDVEIRVKNFGPTPHADVPLVLRAGGGAELFKTTLTLGADASQTVRTTVRFDKPGTQVLSATAGQSPADDRVDYAVDVVPPVRVLVISGDERPGAFRSESDFVRIALAPFASLSRKGSDVAALTVRSSETWQQQDLQSCDVVVLANLPQLAQQQVRSIESFVYGGGGLLVAPGNLTRIDSYNTLLYRDGAGVVGAALLTPTPGDGSAATSLLGLELTHPIFRFLAGRPDPVPASVVGRYFPTTVRPTDAHVLARFASGQPFVVESGAGRGRVLLVTTPLDADWGTLPLGSFYLPFVQSAVRYLASTGDVQRNLLPGEPIVATLPGVPDTRTARLTPPDRADETVPVVRVGERYEARYADTDLPGRYRMRARVGASDIEQVFVVRRPPQEADLTPLTEAKWDELKQWLGFDLVDPARGDLAALVSSERGGRELWPALLALTLLLMTTEMGLARRWSKEGT